MTQEPPRSTRYSSPKKTSEYSLYGKARKPGYLSKKDEVYCQTAPCACSSSAPTVFTAFSHSGSVGRRFPAQRA